MSGLGCRVGRLLPRLQHLSRQTGLSLSRRGVEVQFNQTNIRTLVLTQRNHKLQPAIDQDNDALSNIKSPASTSIKSLEEDDLDRMLYKLDLEVRRTGRVMAFELENIIQTVKRVKVCTSTQALLLLKFCGTSLTDKSKADRSKILNDVVKLVKPLVKFDVSHYNAILKVHLENENSMDVSAFLAEMEADDVAPNRASYQHLIGLYCMDGDIEKATTVLEHMKAEDISINEFVFHSLLRGHTINKDTESVNEVLEIMENSSLLPGADTYTVLLTAAAKVRDWDRVEELLVQTKEKDIKLDAADIFKIIVALCENKMTVQADSLVSMIPKRAGYFQNMRSALPQIVFAGAFDTALNLFHDFKVKKPDDADFNESKGANYLGVLIASSSTTDPAECARAIYDLYEKEYTDVVNAYMVKCIELGEAEKVQALADVVKEKTGQSLDSILRLEGYQLFSRNALANISNQENLDRVLDVLDGLGFRLDKKRICGTLVRQNFDFEAELPGICVQRIKRKFPSLLHWMLQGNMIQHLLEQNSEQHMLACTGFMLSSGFQGGLRPRFFTAELARCYLNTMNLDHLVSMLFVAKKMRAPDDQKNEVYEVLQKIFNFQKGEKIQPDLSASEVLVGVLRELNHHKLGVPRQLADELKALHEDQEMHSLLDTAVADFESDHWTEETELKFLEERRKIYTAAAKKAGYNRTQNTSDSRYYGRYFEIPEDVNEMRRARDIIKRRGNFNPKLISKLAEALAVDNRPGEAVKELQAALQQDSTFGVEPNTSRAIVQSFVRVDDLSGGEDFFFNYGDTSAWFSDAYLSIIQAYAAKGDTEKAIELLTLDHNKTFVYSKFQNEYTDLLAIYENAGDIENLQKVIDAILSAKDSDPRRRRKVLPSLVRVHLVREDVPAALSAFEDAAKQFKVLPAKPELTKRLIEDENLDGLQKIVDVSISVIGEELTLYDLTVVFLSLGRRAQAKKMLETPGLMYNHKKVSRILEQAVGNNDLDFLQDFVRLSKNVFGCDRDFMYLAWVKAVKSGEKVNDIWLEIQEEGHAPSTELKTKIAKSLKAANLQIPFDTTDLDLEGARKSAVKLEKEVKKQETKQQEKTKEAKQPETSATEKAAKEVARAIAGNDVTALTQALKSKDLPLQDFRSGLKYLISESKLDEVEGVFGEATNSKLKQSMTQIDEFSKALCAAKGLPAVEKFVSSLPKFLAPKGEGLLNSLKMADPAVYIASVKAADLSYLRPVLLSHQKLCDKISQNPEVLEELEKMSAEGSAPATVLLTRYSCGKEDSDSMVKYWSMIDEKDREQAAKRIFVSIDSMDRLRWVGSVFNQETMMVKEAVNNSLLNSKNMSAPEALDYALENGCTIQDMGTRLLENAVKQENFKHKDEVKRVLEERKQARKQGQAEE